MSGRAVRRLRSTLFVLIAVLLVVSGCGPSDSKQDSPAKLDAGPGWASGVWLGGALSAKELRAFARWRGSAADVATTYPAYDTWQQIADSDWHVSTFHGFKGRLAYGLPLLPDKEAASLKQVAAGQNDSVWRDVAQTLLKHGRGDSFIRVGLEANGSWSTWGATASTAEDFKAAYRHVVKVMSALAPQLEFVFDISCSVALRGAEEDRLASLTRLYPGDDVVDVVGCDHYDSYTAIAHTDAEWAKIIAPTTGPGLADVVAFARSVGKKFAVPEWGLTATTDHGGGDNPFFVRKMYAFFKANQDVLAFENYFDEPVTSLGSSMFLKPQNPRSASVYRQLW